MSHTLLIIGLLLLTNDNDPLQDSYLVELIKTIGGVVPPYPFDSVFLQCIKGFQSVYTSNSPSSP